MRIGRLLILLAFLLVVFPVFARTADLQALLDEYVAQDDPGVVLLYSYPNDEIVTGARGMADLEAGTPVRETDRFRIGSTTKMFIAVVTLQLAEEGALSLDEGITDYLADSLSANIANSSQITIKQLLNMTSGIFDYTESDAFNEAVDADPTHLWTAAEVIDFVRGETPYFAPGAGCGTTATAITSCCNSSSRLSPGNRWPTRCKRTSSRRWRWSTAFWKTRSTWARASSGATPMMRTTNWLI